VIIHGGPKIMGGPARWEKLGGAMGNLGVDFAPVFWGFMAAFSEFGGGILLGLGLLYRPASLFLMFTMFVAAVTHLSGGDGWGKASHAIEMCILFLGAFFIGPGKYSLDTLISKFRKKE
jgi:putative oxidoreductase